MSRAGAEPSGPVEALAFIATGKIRLSDTPWTLAGWRTRHKPDFMPMTRDWMAGYGNTDPVELERRWQAELARLRGRDTA